MRFRLTLPTNEAFFQRYAGLVPTLSKLGILAQIVSALTEIGILFALIRGAVADVAPPMVATGAGVVGAILATGFIEIGLRKFLPFAARQILNRRFAGLDLVMSLAIFAASLLLLTASGYLSFKGSKDTVATVTPPAKQANFDATRYDAKRDQAQTAWSRDSAAISARYASQLAALESAHKAATDAAKTKLNGIEGRERNTGQSFSTQKASIKQAIADGSAAHAAKIADIHSQQAAELKERQQAAAVAIAGANEAEQAAAAKLTTKNAEAEAKRQQQVKVWGGSVAYFTVLCLVVLLLAIALQEVHAHGSGMTEQATPNEYHFRESPFSAFWGAITERYHSKVFAIIKTIEDGTPPPPEPGAPPTVYEYTQTMTRRPIGFKPIPLHRKPEDTHVSDGSSAMEELKDLSYNATVITEQNAPGKIAPKQCEHCGQLFPPKVVWQKFCSGTCKEAHHTAKHGGRKFDPSLKRKK
jgi:hypothetical protein